MSPTSNEHIKTDRERKAEQAALVPLKKPSRARPHELPTHRLVGMGEGGYMASYTNIRRG